MRLKVPITGTVLDFDPDAARLDGIGIQGDENDPVCIALGLGNVSWRLVSVDLMNDTAEIEVSPGEYVTELKAGGNPLMPADWTSRTSTPTEKQGFLDDTQNRVAAHQIDPAKKLVKSAEVVKKYTDFHKMQG